MNQDLVSGLNDALARLGCTKSFVSLPPLPKGVERLDVSVAVVDDSAKIFEIFLPLLTALCGRPIHFVHHRGEPSEELVDALFAVRPRVALLDRYLYGPLRGETLVEPLKNRDPSMLCIGFSSDPGAERLFSRAGGDGFVEKRADDPGASIEALYREISALVR